MQTLTGWTAIDHAAARGWTLHKFSDPIEPARHGLTVDEARAVAAFDPGLIYIDLEEITLPDGSKTVEVVP